jgi:transposase
MNEAALHEKIDFLETALEEKESQINSKDKIINEKNILISELKEKEKQLSESERLIKELKEKITLLEILHYGPKSEKWTKVDDRQALLFNEAEDEAFTQTDETGEKSEVEKIEVASHKRRKHRGQGRKPISPDLPREIIERDLSEEEKICECGSEMKCIGEDTSERVKIIPAKVSVVREIKKKYACRECEGTEDERPGVVTAKGTKHLITGSIADESLLAWSISEKFEFSLPYYRQTKRLEYIGAPISRSTLCNLSVQTAHACKPVYELLKNYIKSGPLINADETRVQVLKEPGRKAETLSWMWVFSGGPPGKEAVVFQYDQSRGSDIPYHFLKGYEGTVQTDDYGAYHTALKKLADSGQKNLPRHVLCWAHARRYFVKAWDTTKSQDSKQAIEYIRQLFALEKLRNEYSLRGFFKQRKNRAEQIFEIFEPWLINRFKVIPSKSALGKAVVYTLDNWKQLISYVEDPACTPSNNKAENAIRPFVVGRKNWLFSGTPAGAEASAIHYSLIESAKLNKLNPFEYLYFIYSKIPYAKTQEDFISLLPFNLDPEKIKGG